MRSLRESANWKAGYRSDQSVPFRNGQEESTAMMMSRHTQQQVARLPIHTRTHQRWTRRMDVQAEFINVAIHCVYIYACVYMHNGYVQMDTFARLSLLDALLHRALLHRSLNASEFDLPHLLIESLLLCSANEVRLKSTRFFGVL